MDGSQRLERAVRLGIAVKYVEDEGAAREIVRAWLYLGRQ